jgi:outer membrane protein
MREVRLKKIFVAGALALGWAAMAQGQTASASGAAVRQAPAIPASPTGNIVALPSKIAVISLQPAIMGTKEGTAAGAALQAKYAPRQAEFEKRKADLAALQDQLRKGGAAMSDDARAKLTREIDSKGKSLQRDAKEASDDSQQDMNSVYNQLGDKMLQIIEQYAYQNGYAVVLDVSAQQTPVIWAAGSANITADIVRLYDLAHPGAALAPAPNAPPRQPAAPPKQPAAPATVKKQ